MKVEGQYIGMQFSDAIGKITYELFTKKLDQMVRMVEHSSS